jgi:hypothetical protein
MDIDKKTRHGYDLSTPWYLSVEKRRYVLCRRMKRP